MNVEQSKEISDVLKNHYGATQVIIDRNNVMVYGVTSEFATLAIENLVRGSKVTVISDSTDDKKECLMKVLTSQRSSVRV
jgi:hypothetical protein